MKTGMLWCDNTGTFGERVERAASYYQRKYGVRPTVVFANPKDAGSYREAAGLSVKSSRSVQKDHLWLGTE